MHICQKFVIAVLWTYVLAAHIDSCCSNKHAVVGFYFCLSQSQRRGQKKHEHRTVSKRTTCEDLLDQLDFSGLNGILLSLE